MKSPEVELIREESSKGEVIAIRPAYEVGAEGSFPVAIIRKLTGAESWIALPEPNDLNKGDRVTILSSTRVCDKGSVTSYTVSRDSSER